MPISRIKTYCSHRTTHPSFCWSVLIAFFGAILANYPYWVFQFDGSALKDMKPWTNDFATTCAGGDCNIYPLLSKDLTHAYSRVFFPLFPILIRAFNWLFPQITATAAAIVVSNIFALAAGMLILFLGDQLWASSERKWYFRYESWLLLLAISWFPHHHFWMRGFTEPLFMFGILTATILIHKERWIAASLFSGILATSRPQAIWFLGAVLGYLSFLQIRGWHRAKKKLEVPNMPLSWTQYFITCITALVPLVLFVAWHWKTWGSPFNFYKVQTESYGRSFNLLQGFRNFLPRWDMSVAYLYLSLAASYRFIKRPEASWKVTAISCFMFAVFPLFIGGFYSYTRFMCINLGMFLLIAELVRDRAWLGILLAGWSVSRLAEQTYHSVFGGWVG